MFKISLDSEYAYEGINYSYLWFTKTETEAKRICNYIAKKMDLVPTKSNPNRWINRNDETQEFISLDCGEILFSTLKGIKECGDLPY